MKNKKLIIGISAAAAVLVVGGGIWFALGRDGSDNDENVVYVTTVESLTSQGNVAGALNRFAGVVETQEKLEIQPNQEKKVKEIYVEEGQEVEVGTPLFSYDTENDKENLSKAQLELERISNTIGNKYNEIAALEKEKRNASSDAKLDYTLQIQSAQMELKQSEYEKKSKQVEIQKLQDNIENAEVVSEMAGVVKSINNGNNENVYYGESQAFMTIIAMGDFRVKGKINEQNIGSIMPGQSVIVHSRLDDNVTWKGVMGEVDRQNPGNDSGNMYYSGGDSMTQTNSYPFYVELESSEGLMLGQHVYIEVDYGQEEERAGIWLTEYMIGGLEEDDPYVWADNGKGKLEKRKITLGQYDEELFEYEIADGLSEEDMITYPEEGLEEGMPTVPGEYGQMGQSNPPMMEDGMEGEIIDDEMVEDGMTEGGMDGEGMPADEMMEEESGTVDGETEDEQ
ncbi:MAG: efflux RND transporter periplasmic adaptor subunit [Oliverpabstia sp.]